MLEAISLSILFSLVNNVYVLNCFIKKASTRNLKISLDFHSQQTRELVLKEFLLTITPILNLLHSLQLDVYYISYNSTIFDKLKNLKILKNMSTWESSHTKKKDNIFKILLTQIKYHIMQKCTDDVRDTEQVYEIDSNNIYESEFDEVEFYDEFWGIKQDYLDISNQTTQDLSNNENLKLVRKKKNKKNRKKK